MNENINKDLDVLNAEIIFRNFSGRETDYNRAGDRNFSVVIPSVEEAIRLYNAGWNVQIRPKEQATRVEMKTACKTFDERIEWLSSRGELDDALFHLKVSVSYKYPEKQPKIYLVRGDDHKMVRMTESNISTLDKAEIVNIDLTINPSYWSKAGRSGYMAFLKTAYVTIQESEVSMKYRDYYEDGEEE